MRLPYAAETLIDQVGEKYKNVNAVPDDDLDGFGVARTISFDSHAGKWLAKILPGLDDERILAVGTQGGVTSVTFVGGIEADQRDRFALDAAELVITMAEEQDEK